MTIKIIQKDRETYIFNPSQILFGMVTIDADYLRGPSADDKVVPKVWIYQTDDKAVFESTDPDVINQIRESLQK